MDSKYSPRILFNVMQLFKIFFVGVIITFILFCIILINVYSNLMILSPGSDYLQISSSLLKKPLLQKEMFSYNISILSPCDTSTLINMTNFTFLINNSDKCNQKDIFMIIFIHSAAENFIKRDTIRQTWGNPNNFVHFHYQIKLIFLLGLTDNLDILERIDQENKLYKDIVQGNFIDTYRNMTYKHIMGLKWISYYCQNARYVFKADDDIFVDIFQLVYYLKGTYGDFPKNLMTCYLFKHSYANRSYRNKWRVSHNEYSNKYYPNYCAGWGIIMSPDVVFDLYRISRSRSYFWIDDVFVSGLLAQDLQIKHTDLSERVSFEHFNIEDWLNKDELTLPPMFGLPNSQSIKIFRLWNKTTQYYKNKFHYNFL